MSRSEKMLSASECRTPHHSSQLMVQEQWIEWVREYRRSGSAGASGAMALNRIARLVLQRNTLWCHCGKQYCCRKASAMEQGACLGFLA